MWLLALSAFVLSLWVEFFSTRILASSLALSFDDALECDWWVITFWAGCVLWATAMAFRAYHEFSERERIDQHILREHLSRSVHELTDMLRTLVKAELVVRELDDSLDPAEAQRIVVNQIQLVLERIVTWTARFAGRREDAYGANVFVTVAPMHDDESLSRFHHLLVNKDLKADLVACLLLPHDLRRVPGKLQQQLDKMGLPSFLLPVGRDLTRGSVKVALPGAPEAFLRRDICVYQSISEVAKETEHFSMEVRNAVSEHFAQKHGKGIASFLSMPIVDPRDDSQVIGVLNVDCTMERPLSSVSQDVLQDYYTLGEVCTTRLAVLVERYVRLLEGFVDE